ncbi:adenosylcobinamide-phosphate synthase CbiB [Bacillus rubiinfantis]|uniref:adenosylcobinamide-phosphate synthase CbiB n=1 Tax=Bacillus rubiinfantis TaxID=1499680 RepID=UPI0005AAE30B|nr:adenosylcobinamide-phosphate synthase CbiB [Bacillus rubiinfantis]
MILHHLSAITVAYVIDLLVGDPPNWPHPVRWIGSLISALEKRLNHGAFRKMKGVIMLAIVLITVCLLVSSFVYLAYKINTFIGIFIEGVLLAATIAQKSLKEAAVEVYNPLRKADLPAAREKLSYIVGRDTEALDESEISRAAIETVAENTSDGVTAPLFWALIGGAPLAFIYRAANTCDSMVGNFSERYKEFGWASAKWDDIMNWLPSRLTGIVMLVGNRPNMISYKRAWSILFRDAQKHPSPNSGWGEAAVAAILGIQLGGINYYKGIISNRAKMGEALFPIGSCHILQANRILARTVLLFIMLLWLGGVLVAWLVP